MTPSSRRPTALLAFTVVLTALLTVGSSSRLTANTSLLPPGALAPTARERMIARQVGSLLEEAHYSKLKIDDSLSPRVMDKFIDGLDGQRSYFLASDIAEFESHRLRFDDMIRTGDIEPAYLIFARYQQRNRERVQHALALLDREPDFALNESFEFDRESAPWAKDSAELDELWRKRVKNDAISLLLTNKSWAEARDVLRTPDDQARFAYTVTAHLAWVPVDATAAIRKLGAPVALRGCEVSPAPLITLPTVMANPDRGTNPRRNTWRFARRLSEASYPGAPRAAPIACDARPAAVIGDVHVESSVNATSPVEQLQS